MADGRYGCWMLLQVKMKADVLKGQMKERTEEDIYTVDRFVSGVLS